MNTDWKKIFRPEITVIKELSFSGLEKEFLEKSEELREKLCSGLKIPQAAIENLTVNEARELLGFPPIDEVY
jgi:hypothetical protein